MPFMRSLTENTVRGNLYVPVIGAGTSNTEFEFLTGHTTAFLPSGSNAYMLYIKDAQASLVSTVEAQGYSSYALHPYYAMGWKRTEVYNNFGFNDFISLEDIIDISLMEEYQDKGNDPNYLNQLVNERYPGKNMLIRQYISDAYNYKLLIEDFENRDKNKPYFAFNVTMQNHGGYTTSAENFDESIYATSTSKAYNKTNKYLSLVKQSDNAFKDLINYFSKVKEPTVICMFGDHQPSVESDFIAETLGVSNLSNLTPEQEQARHCTPFFIWANYDIEEKQIDKLSSNYLSSLVLETAGVKLTEYNRYLLELSKTLPVIDTVGYIDNNGTYYKWSDASPYTHLLDDYERVQYNSIFDRKNVNSDIFFIDGYELIPNSLQEKAVGE
ncbi:MAG: LTA synthase family protein [Clostridia bacterium]|nr:LTA synthase family protein [Clostridia bacterium]